MLAFSLAAPAFGASANAAFQAGAAYTRGRHLSTSPLTDDFCGPRDTLAPWTACHRYVVEASVDVAHARDREIQIRLEPVTRTVTRMRLVVSEGQFWKDRATASEIVAQTERSVDARLAAPAPVPASARAQRRK